ncbi:hypothetical protein BDV12DRAFT_191229 [Aspergillus spectabilis]
MASNAHCRGRNMPLSQPTRLGAPGSRLKGVTPDSTRRREDLRVAEPIHDDNVREGRDDCDSSDGDDSRWRHGEVAGGSDSGFDGVNVNSLDVSGLLEEYAQRADRSLGIQYGGTGAVEQRGKSGSGSALVFPADDRNNCGKESGPLKAATD